MRVVVADTGPLRYLLAIGHIDILPQLFETISIPTCSPRRTATSSRSRSRASQGDSATAQAGSADSCANRRPRASNPRSRCNFVLGARCHVGRMHDFDARITRKPASIECQDRSKGVRQHGGNQPRVMRWFPGHLILALPYRVNGRGIRQQLKHALDAHELGGRLRGCQSEAVVLDWGVSRQPRVRQGFWGTI